MKCGKLEHADNNAAGTLSMERGLYIPDFDETIQSTNLRLQQSYFVTHPMCSSLFAIHTTFMAVYNSFWTELQEHRPHAADPVFGKIKQNYSSVTNFLKVLSCSQTPITSSRVISVRVQ
jgi:hypothetical protein